MAPGFLLPDIRCDLETQLFFTLTFGCELAMVPGFAHPCLASVLTLNLNQQLFPWIAGFPWTPSLSCCHARSATMTSARAFTAALPPPCALNQSTYKQLPAAALEQAVPLPYSLHSLVAQRQPVSHFMVVGRSGETPWNF